MRQAPVPRMPHESYAEPPVSALIECVIGEGVKGVQTHFRVAVGIEAPPLIADLIDRATMALGSDLNVARQLLVQAAAMLRANRAAHERPAERSATNAAGLALAPWQLDRILIYIEENFADRLRNCELAQLISLSTSHFSRAFIGSLGVSPARYVRRRRIEFACNLMVNTKLSLCQIAVASGLCDQAHFCRTFRALFRQTPRAWRRANVHSAPEKRPSREFPVGANLDGRWRSTVQTASPRSL
jgi:AraC family transcriptional regulator